MSKSQLEKITEAVVTVCDNPSFSDFKGEVLLRVIKDLDNGKEIRDLSKFIRGVAYNCRKEENRNRLS